MWSVTQECEEENRIALIHAERASGTEEMAQQEEPEFRSPAHTEMPDWHGNLPVTHHLENGRKWIPRTSSQLSQSRKTPNVFKSYQKKVQTWLNTSENRGKAETCYVHRRDSLLKYLFSPGGFVGLRQS